MFTPINFSPFATNVLDIIGQELTTRDGKKVIVSRNGMNFRISIDGIVKFDNLDNLGCSYVLNSAEVGRNS